MTRVVLVLFYIECVLTLFQTLMMLINLSLNTDQVTAPVYIAMDSIMLATMILLELQTIRASNTLYNESTWSTLERIRKSQN